MIGSYMPYCIQFNANEPTEQIGKVRFALSVNLQVTGTLVNISRSHQGETGQSR